jgi:hypothetical protein
MLGQGLEAAIFQLQFNQKTSILGYNPEVATFQLDFAKENCRCKSGPRKMIKKL